MKGPIEISSVTHFEDIIGDYYTVFAMFYYRSDISTRSMLPIFQSLGEEHSTASTAFIKVKKDDHPYLCTEHRIPRGTSLTFVAFKNRRKVGMTDGSHSKDLEQLADDHIRVPGVRPRSRSRHRHRSPHAYLAIHRSSRSESSSRAPRPSRRPRSSVLTGTSTLANLLGLARTPTSIYSHGHEHGAIYGRPRDNNHQHHHHPGPGYSMPAQVFYTPHRSAPPRPRSAERPVRVEYRGRDGHYHRADDIRLQQTTQGTEATYLDWSGPIAVERNVGEYVLG